MLCSESMYQVQYWLTTIVSSFVNRYFTSSVKSLLSARCWGSRHRRIKSWVFSSTPLSGTRFDHGLSRLLISSPVGKAWFSVESSVESKNLVESSFESSFDLSSVYIDSRVYHCTSAAYVIPSRSTLTLFSSTLSSTAPQPIYCT